MLAVLGGCCCAYALDPTRAISQYHKRHWQVEDGLPRNYVLSILPARNGYLMVGTDEGLTRFDGVRFTPYDIDTALRLSQRWILTLLTARDGSLWVGTFDGLLYQSRAGKLVNRFEPGGSVFSVIEDTTGRIWASTRRGVMRYSDDGRQESVKELARPPETGWNVLSQDRNGAIWVVTIDGLFRCRDGVIDRISANGEAHGQILAVTASNDGNVWVGTSVGLFLLREPGKRLQESRLIPQTGIRGPVVSMLRDRDGNLWAGTWGNGMYRLANGRVDSWAARDGLPDDFIRTLYEDAEGNLWIGTRGGGLNRWKDTAVVPVGVPEGLGGNYATTVASGPRGELWLGTWRGGLYREQGGALESQPTPVPALYCSVRALAIDPHGHPWIGNWEGLFGFDGQRYRRYAGPESPYHLVAAILFDRRGRLWVGTSNNGVFLFPDGEPTGTPLAFLPHMEVTSLLEDSRGRVWVGTTEGYGWFEGDSNPVLSLARGIPKNMVSSITEDTRGQVWAATIGGTLYRIAPGDIRILGQRQGLPGHPIYQVQDDGAGSYWLSSSKGILRVPGAQVDEVLAGRRQSFDVATYDQEDGMRTVECHRLSQPAGGRQAGEGIWFPTTKGFVRIEPARVRPLQAPAVFIEESTLDGRTQPASSGLDIEPGTHVLEIHFTALRFASPGKINFRYRMEGFDPDWIDAGGERTARYSRLPPGRYRFLVSARMPAGAWSTAPAAFAVRQMPRFHQTGLFLVLLGMIFVAGAVGLIRWREFIVRSRYAAVLAERNRIAREWHDTLLAGFSAISWQLEETLSRLREVPGKATETVETALKMVQHYRAEARQVIWDLRENRPETETLAGTLSSALQQALPEHGIEGGVTVAGDPVRLAEDVERNILRICQEAAANALRHARPSRIDVHLDYAKDFLILRVRDDGCGFAPKDFVGIASGHFGLAVMKERAERCNGRFRLDSGPGKGTIVEAIVPILPAPSR